MNSKTLSTNYRTVRRFECDCQTAKILTFDDRRHTTLTCGCEFCPNYLTVVRCDSGARLHRRLSKYINLANAHNRGESA